MGFLNRLLLSMLLFCGQAWAGCSMSLCGVGRTTSGGFTPNCTASSNFLALASGITLTADKTNYDTLICGLNTDGVLAKLDALYIFAAPTQAAALLNLVQNAYNPTTVSTVSFSAYVGFTGNGTSFALDTGFNPSTAVTPNFTVNSASLGAYDRTADTTQTATLIGAATVHNDDLTFFSTTFLCRLSAGAGSSSTPASSQGFSICNRTDVNTLGVSTNGGALANATHAATGIDNGNIAIFAMTVGVGSYSTFTADQLSAAFIGGSLTNTDISNMSSRVNTFMTAYGINVY